MAAAFARQAAFALELAESRDAEAELMRMQDHDRIAGDMHDQVLQQLFAIGMGLQGLAGITDDPNQRGRLIGSVDGLDNTISAIRTTIFQLRIDQRAPASFKTQILNIATQHTSQLGSSPNVRFAGPLNETITDVWRPTSPPSSERPPPTGPARHAHATRLEISIELTDQRILVEVIDGGRGSGPRADPVVSPACAAEPTTTRAY
jgi:signal transduction histidine kinase